MGKKGLKRKTRWRPLSISECTTIIDDTNTTSSVASITNSTTETNIEEDDTTTYKYSVKNSSYLRRRPFTSSYSASSTNNRTTDYRNNYNNNSNSNYYYRNISNKHNNNNNNINNTISLSSSTNPLYSSSSSSSTATTAAPTTTGVGNTTSTRYSYRRRPFSTSNHHNYHHHQYQQQNDSFNNSNHKYYSGRLIGNGGGGGIGNRISNGGRSINHRIYYHRTISEPSDKENSCISSSSKPQLNEDEYTRITTPRQDVIFKKSYLNQPKRYLSSTDTNTTSSAAASVVSTEESISAISVPSLSPEQCSSMTDSIDPEQAFMYSYFDQNGVFYVNPFLPNGFDQYGQMFMLPYGYTPYMFPQDISSPLVNDGDTTEESQISDETNENKNDLKDSNNEIINNNDNEKEEKEENNNTENKIIINNNINNNDNNINNNNNDKDKNLSESCDSIQKTIRIQQKITSNDKLNLNNNNDNENNNTTINNTAIINTRISDDQNDDKNENDDEKKDNNEEETRNANTITADGTVVTDVDVNKSLPSSSSSLSEPSLSPSSSSSSSTSASSTSSSSSSSSNNIDMEKNEECKNDNNKIECNENNNNNGAKMNNSNSNSNVNNNNNNKIDHNNINNKEMSIDHNHTKNYIKEAEIFPTCDPNDYYNYGYHQFYPHPIFYPYMYGQPFIPIFTKEYQTSADLYDGDDRNNGAKRRKRMKLDENSTDVTTTDYSEDENDCGGYTEDDDDITETPENNAVDVNDSSVGCEICDSLKENRLANNDEKDGTERIGLNTNVEEFVPKANKPHLNVHVKEFHPRRYKLRQRNEPDKITKIPNKTEKIESSALTVDKHEKTAVVTETQNIKINDEQTELAKVESHSESRVLTEEKNDEVKNICSQKTLESVAASSLTINASASPPLVVIQQKEEKLKKAAVSSSPPSTKQSLTKERKLYLKTQSPDKPIITLAEKIKRALSEESKTKIQNQNAKPMTNVSKPATSLKSNSEPPKMKRTERKMNSQRNPKNIDSGKQLEQPPQPQRKKQLQPRNKESQDPKTRELQKLDTETIKSVPTYAQMLNNDTKSNTKINKRNPANEKSTKELPIESLPQQQQQQQQDNKQNSVQSNNHKTAENASAQVWVTVKSKGKRSKQIKEVVTAFEDDEINISDDNNRVSVAVREEMNEANEVKAESVPVPKEITNNSDTKETSSKNIELEDSKVSTIAEETSPIQVADKNDANPTVLNKNKNSKSKNKKSRKSSSVLNKKMKGFELKESKFEVGKKNQSEKESQNVSLPLFEESQVNVNAVNIDNETLLKLTPKESEEDLTLTHLYGHDKKNPFSRTFASSSLEMLNGFDYKFYKGASILKEEEEMVLNVIKSLSHNQKKISSSKKTTDGNQHGSNQVQDLKETETEKIEIPNEIKNEIAINENTSDEPHVNEEIQLGSEIPTESVIENSVEDQLEIETSTEKNVLTTNLGNGEEIIEVKENPQELNSQCSGNREDIVSESSVSSELSEDTCEDSETVSQQQEQQEQEKEQQEQEKEQQEHQFKLENSIKENQEQLQKLENLIKDSHDIPIETKSSITNEVDHLICNGTLEVVTNGNITNGHCGSISLDSDENSESFQFDSNQDEKHILNKTSIEKDEYNQIESKIETTVIIPENCTVLNGELAEQTHIAKMVNCIENDVVEKMSNGINKEIENDSVSDTETISRKKDDPKDDFYKLLKVDNIVSTSIADRLKTIEDQLKNLERIASVTSLNGSRTDISSNCTSDNETASNLDKNHKNATLCLKNSQTAEKNFRNDNTITISSNSSIPSDRNESIKSVFNGNSIAHQDSLNSSPVRETIRNQSNPDNNTNDHSCNINVVDKDNYNNSSSNSTKNVILVPNDDDHVLNGYEQTQLLLVNNEFETSNHIQQDDKKNDSSPEPIITQTAIKTSSVDRIQSNSLEYCCNQGNDQNNCNNSNEIPLSMVCGNSLKAVSDSSINNATDSICKYPLTNAVRKWLKDNTKDEIPEQILRIPDDPTLSTRIKSKLVEQYDHSSYDDSDSELDDDQHEERDQHKATGIASASALEAVGLEEIDEENIKRYEINNYPLNHSKNLISNPSHVSSVKKNDYHQKINRHFRMYDNLNGDEIDSDYNSDNQNQYSNQLQFTNIKNIKSKSLQSHSQHKRFDFDDNTCERVASLLISGTTTTIITTEDEDESEQDQYIKMNNNNNDNMNLNKIHNLVRNDIITIPPISINHQKLQNHQLFIQQQILESHKNSINNDNSNDLLDYWDDEFIQNPKKWLRRSSSNEFHTNNNNNNNTIMNNDTCGDVHKSEICNIQNERIKQKNLEKKKKRKRKTKRKSTLTASSLSTAEAICTETSKTTTTTTNKSSLSSSKSISASTSALSRSLSERSSTTTLSIDEIELIPYDSVYGKTIDYKRLLCNNNNNNNLETLSNSYINNNLNNLNLNYKNFKMNQLRTITNYNNTNNNIKRNLIIDMKQQLQQQQQQQQNDHNESFNNDNNNDHTMILQNNNFDNDQIKFSGNTSKMINNNINCLKPPEVCCILM